MSSAPNRRPTERLLMAFLALVFLLQPLALASEGCVARARLLGRSCCCATEARELPAAKSCCSKEAQPRTPAPAPKRCGCEVSAPVPLPPPASALHVQFLSELAVGNVLPPAFRAQDAGLEPVATHGPPIAHGPPRARSCFQTHLASSLARALAFERCLRS